MAQPGLRAGLRAIDLLKAAPRNDAVLADLASVYLFVGALYRSAGSLVEAQRFFQEGAQLSPALATPQRRLFWAGAFGRALGELAYARRDLPAAAQQVAEAVKQFEQFLANASASGFDLGRRNAQRHLVLALTLMGDIERQPGTMPPRRRPSTARSRSRATWAPPSSSWGRGTRSAISR